MPRPKTLKEYRVAWDIELDATSPRKAAQEALRIMRDPASTAVVFDVYRLDTGNKTDAARLLADYEPVTIDLFRYLKRKK